MNRSDENPYANHDNVAMLLPWYVNRTLRGAELNVVEQHLKICLVCKRELLDLQQFAVAVKQPGPLDTSAQASFSRFKKRLPSAETSPSPSSEMLPVSQNKGQGKLPPKPSSVFRLLLALAATVLLAVLLPRAFDVKQISSNDYRTLSDPETLKSNANELRVIFKEKASPQAIKQILASIEGHIIDGPNGQSLYTIGFDHSTSAGQVVDKLSLLRKNGLVVFAEPAYGLLSHPQPEQAKK